MFNLAQLQLLYSALNKEGIGYSAKVARLVADTNDILESNIKELDEREKRKTAALQLRAVGGTDSAPEALSSSSRE